MDSRYFDYSIFVGAGSLYSTTHDLYKWMAGLYSGSVLQPGSIEQMFTRQVGSRGYGWLITQESGREVIGLDGWSNTGFTSSLSYYPNEDLTVVILNNINIRGVKSEIAEGISAIVFGEDYTPLSFDPAPVGRELARKIVGTYQMGNDYFVPGAMIRIIEQEGNFFAVGPLDGSRIRLLRVSELEFIHRSGWDKVKFDRSERGEITGLLFDGRFRADKVSEN